TIPASLQRVRRRPELILLLQQGGPSRPKQSVCAIQSIGNSSLGTLASSAVDGRAMRITCVSRSQRRLGVKLATSSRSHFAGFIIANCIARATKTDGGPL